MVPAVFLLAYGHPLLLCWVGAGMANQSGPLIPIFLLAYTLVLAAQYNSSSLLYGIGHHGGYARGLAVEAIVLVVALSLVVPRFGITGAVWANTALMILVRGIYTSWLVTRSVGCSWLFYMKAIYIRPLLAGIPALAVAFALKLSVLPGKTWPQLIAAGSTSSLVYLTLAFFVCVPPSHRQMLRALWENLHARGRALFVFGK